MVVRAAGDEAHAALYKLLGHGGGVQNDLVLVGGEVLAHGLLEADGLGGDDVLQRAALRAGEDGLVDGLGVLLAAEDEAAAGAAQRLVGGGGDHVGIGHGAHVLARSHEAGDVGHVHHQHRAHFIGDLAELGKVDGAGVGAGAGDDQFRLVFEARRRTSS